MAAEPAPKKGTAAWCGLLCWLLQHLMMSPQPLQAALQPAGCATAAHPRGMCGCAPAVLELPRFHAALQKLYVCEYSLQFFKRRSQMLRHMAKVGAHRAHMGSRGQSPAPGSPVAVAACGF